MNSTGRRVAVWGGGALIVALALFVVSALATDRSSFCASCHEMVPYHDAWAVGAHKGRAECIDCHVDPGLANRFAHKFVALQEVYAHFTGDNSFPRVPPPQVPEERCRTCHEKVVPKRAAKAFDHAAHETYEPCQTCHARTGHDVSAAALKAAGIFDPAAAAELARGAVASDAVAVPGRGKANLPGHKDVICTQCHDMAKTGCPACHTPPSEDHPKDENCARCHKPGEKFVFSHPTAGADCSGCHKPPAGDHPAGTDCAGCHKNPGKSWAFGHPGAGADCSRCHEPPATGHPAGAGCAACHRQPGRSWAFTHTGNTGEHSYRSFACAKCHPRGFASATCTCHKNGIPSD